MHVGMAGNNGKGLVAIGVRHPSRAVWSTRGNVVRGVGFLVRCLTCVREGKRGSGATRLGTQMHALGALGAQRTLQSDVTGWCFGRLCLRLGLGMQRRRVGVLAGEAAESGSSSSFQSKAPRCPGA
jgi:hypothetical protein